LVVGDIMLDRYHIGEHTGKSPEANVPLVVQTQIDDRLGGAGNVANNLHSLGLIPILVAVIGDDEEGQVLQKLCAEKFEEFHLFTIPDRPTTLKSRIVSEDFQQFLRLDREETKELSSEMEKKIIDQFDKVLAIKNPAAVVIQDYNKGLITPKVIKHIQAKAGIPIIVDPKKKHFRLLSDCSVFKPNLKELSQALGRAVVPNTEAIGLAIKELGLDKSQLVFVTLAEKGIYFLDQKTGESGILEGFEIEQPDVSGAGDTVLSALVKLHLEELPARKMAELANHAGAAVCRKKGIQVVKIEELKL